MCDLGAGGVGEHVFSVGVADTVNMRNGLSVDIEDIHFFVHWDKPPTIGLHTDRLQIESIRIRCPSRGHQTGIDFQNVDFLFGMEIGQFDQHRLDVCIQHTVR